jgi:hypothetical protein
MSKFPKDKSPHSARVLEGWLREFATKEGVAEGRLRRATSFMVLALALERAVDPENRPLFIVKGGVSMELRLNPSELLRDARRFAHEDPQPESEHGHDHEQRDQ